MMKIGIIGYGSMGKMLLWKFSEAGKIGKQGLMVSNRTMEKLKEAEDIACIVTSRQLAAETDIIFVCVRPSDIKQVLEEISDVIRKDALLVSLNGSVSFETISRLTDHKAAKVIPSLTAEIERSQTLVCYNSLVNEEDKTAKSIISSINTYYKCCVIQLVIVIILNIFIVVSYKDYFKEKSII